MFSSVRRSLAYTTLLALGMTAITINPLIVSKPASAQTPVPTETPSTTGSNFSDVSSDYWAQPFIQALAQRNIIAGFPDGTFRPNQAVSRAEFATLIQKAFNQQPVRQLSASGFTDVPANFWASQAIREAYETGFLSGYPGNVFRPNQQIPRVQAIVALSSGLNLTTTDTASNILSNNYADASAIPDYAVNGVAAATQSNIVVNYPNVRELNPSTSLTRGEAAAILYQALVRQGQVQPLPSNVAAANYVVGGTGTTGGTQGANNIVALAASSNSFSTLTSLLRTAGLTDILEQPGPYTVFAPTNEAFAALPAGTLEQLQQPQNRELLVRILRYHVVPGQLTANQLSSGQLTTASDAPVNVRVDTANNQIAVNEARVVQANIQASNGVIHAINEVLIPPNLTGQQPQEGTPQAQNPGAVTPGRATRGGSSYIGVAGNIGLGGDTALSDSNFAVISKVGLTRNLSVRPSAVFGNDTVFLVPLTLDFTPRAVEPGVVQPFAVSPYVGAGVAIEASGDTDIGLLLTGGVDIPLGQRFTINGAVNAAFVDETDVGLLLGIGYNF
ncbi:Beta-Ig-H3/fasciclin [Trichormus variabilis ATCC 29413]|uniref:Beta-Ig-H3/fasciclin n=2 Tax=Anabaena variabilis TaxID=264691 RepID=Q3M3L5_TRIV2|nr:MULTISPECIES: fasciclin domain-containing protein [Nostocaceae]ABA24421.1 Beta-Ig-H3/fasciclin [Trichormus variabilis ATCC 29413]MBC1214447.1 S-layer homology domain-containing protein [Trichormus variabilis ARAD]MBC1258466.1 S-layer homology domain-containing protein [Trichormus variabilis V5]MBC1269147.1 S-layer homology domain-containing protein [Trichormus variabilis FSR]MBC1301555.1 S-layer homology domain-containing protein [Trichormus variabilis N2B]